MNYTPEGTRSFIPILSPGIRHAASARYRWMKWHSELSTCRWCNGTRGDTGSQRLHRPSRAAGDSMPSLSRTRTPKAKTCGAVWTLPRCLFAGGPSLWGEAQSPGCRTCTHCRSGPELGRANRASGWQSAWRVRTTAPARRAGRGLATEVCRTRPLSSGCLE